MSPRPPTSPAGAVVGLVLAAGAARRFGSPKQLAPFAGRPLLEHALRAMSAAAVDRVAVVLGAYAEAVLASVPLHGAQAVICEDWEEGQAASLRCGVGAVAADAGAVIVILGDQPAIAAAAIDRVVAARDGRSLALRASYGGAPGHPVLLERELFAAVAALRGDEGARRLLTGAAVRTVDCEGLGSDLDVDTVEDLRLSGGGSARSS